MSENLERVRLRVLGFRRSYIDERFGKCESFEDVYESGLGRCTIESL